jgi:hypothetical protein
MKDYPLFVPPEHLVKKHPKEWSSEEAKEYKEWLLEVLDERVKYLIDTLGNFPSDALEDYLIMIGEQVVELLLSNDFSEAGQNGRKLNNRGYALAADMGLLVAKFLLEKHKNNVYWEIIKKPKTELSYNLPVLKGFRFNYLDPISGSTAEASAILRGQRGADAWKKIFLFWSERV